MTSLPFYLLLGLAFCWPVSAQVSPLASKAGFGDNATSRLADYRRELDALRQEFGGVKELPNVPFFLFGMGPRTKLLYKSGTLIDPTPGMRPKPSSTCWNTQESGLSRGGLPLKKG